MRWLGLVGLFACTTGTEAPVDAVDTEIPGPTCLDGTTPRTWNEEGPYGIVRHALADNAMLPVVGGERVQLSELWDGCNTLMFVPDTMPIDGDGSASIWGSGLKELVLASPADVHWIFVSRRTGASADESIKLMGEDVELMLGDLKEAKRAAWADRLHVVRDPAGELNAWVGEVLASGIGMSGFAIDRAQRIRGIGSLADVKRSAGNDQWPNSSLEMAARDARYLERLVTLQDAWAALDGTVIPLFSGEVVEGFADATITLPDAATMKGFDTLEVEVDMRCPNPEAPEAGNCGAWDYLAHLSLMDEEGGRIELARFITSYHRETWWTFDLTPMLALLNEGGERTFRWEWAPEWNKQPTETRLNLRLRNQGRGERPIAITRLFEGGDFNAAYNEGREPVSAAVDAGATRVELWSLITGHGGATNNCAEFCDHQHELTVNSNVHLRTHPTVGLQEGCVDELENGMVPNQWGTWWYGRGGWCPGQAVKPWVVDVTDEVTIGQPATVAYRGLYAGGTPPDNAGNILLNTWWVVYGP